MMTEQKYKELSIKEFTKAAEVYDSGHAGLYEMCKDDYPPVLEELKKYPFQELLDVGCGTGPMIELLLKEFPDRSYTGIDLTPRMIEVAQEKQRAHISGHGDVRIHSCEEVSNMCKAAGLRVEKLEKQKGFRMHLVAVKA